MGNINKTDNGDKVNIVFDVSHCDKITKQLMFTKDVQFLQNIANHIKLYLALPRCDFSTLCIVLDDDFSVLHIDNDNNITFEMGIFTDIFVIENTDNRVIDMINKLSLIN